MTLGKMKAHVVATRAATRTVGSGAFWKVRWERRRFTQRMMSKRLKLVLSVLNGVDRIEKYIYVLRKETLLLFDA